MNHNAGAESTIHALLSMLALDAHPGVAAQAQHRRRSRERVGTVDGAGRGRRRWPAARAAVAADAWTGESQFGGTGYVALPDGGTATIAGRATASRGWCMPVVDLQPGSTAVTTFPAGDTVLGTVRSGDVGPQGDSPAPGALLPVTLPVTLPAGQTTVTASDRRQRRRRGAAGRADGRAAGVAARARRRRPRHGAAAQRGDHRAAAHRVGARQRPATVEVYDGRGRRVSLRWSRRPGAVPVTTVVRGRLHHRPAVMMGG